MSVDLERIGKALPLAVAAIYVVGFLVVASRLANYGISSLELFKIQYLAAGFWCGFIFVIYFGFVIVLRSFCPTGFLGNLLSNGVSIILITGTILFVGAIRSLHFSSLSLLLMFFGLALLDLILRGESSDRLRPLGRSLSWHLGLVLGLLFMFCTIQFSNAIYPYISFSLGGGLPRSVVFVLNEGAGSTSSLLVRDGAGPRTVPYQLLLENENSFVIISPKVGEKAIEFDRKNVAAMIVLESPKKPLSEFLRTVVFPF